MGVPPRRQAVQSAAGSGPPFTPCPASGLGWLPAAAELEYHQPILPGDTPRLLASHATGEVLFWLVNDRGRLASGRLARMPSAAR